MKDDRLISLNAAIDALRDRYYKYDRFANIEELVWAIEALPSAQPTDAEIQRMQDLVQLLWRVVCRGMGSDS